MSKHEPTQDILQAFLFRYRDLVERKIINNRMTLKRWMERPKEEDPFPQPIDLGPNSIAWDGRAVLAWVERRRRKGEGAA